MLPPRPSREQRADAATSARRIRSDVSFSRVIARHRPGRSLVAVPRVGYGSAVTAPAPPPAAPGPWTYLARYRRGLLGGVVMLLVTNAMFLGIPVTTGKVVAALGSGDPDHHVPWLCASMVGFALVLILFVIGLENDIGRLTGEGFNVR